MAVRRRIAAAAVLALVAAACTSSESTPTITSIPEAASPTATAATTTSTPPPTSEAPASDQPAAGVVLTNGEIITVDDDFTIAEAVAITGGDIVAVGAADALTPRIGPETIVVDLEGRAVLPGFIDPHTHALQAHAYLPDIDAMRAEQDHLLAGGVTTIGSPNVKPDDLAGFDTFAADGNVVIRDHLYLSYNDECGNRPFGDYYLSRDFSHDPELRQTVAGGKIFTDGGVCNAPAISIPYPDSVPDRLKARGFVGNGNLYVTADEVAAVVSAVDARGGITVIHAIGDVGNRTALQGLSKAFDDHPFSDPQRIDHNSFTSLLSEDELQQYGRLGMVPAIFPVPFANGCDPATVALWRDILPAEAFAIVENSKALREANPAMRVSWHGDAPSIPALPLQAMFTLVSGGAIDLDSGDVCYPEAWSTFFTVPVQEAIRMATINAAGAMGIERRAGSIEIGKVADLVIVANDPLGPDPETGLAQNQVLVTMINGKVAFCADDVLCEAMADVAGISEPPPPPPGEVLDGGPQWTFDVDGDTEDWVAVNDIGRFEATSGNLVMDIVGDDPWIEWATAAFPATFATMHLTMSISENGPTIGQVFFVTDTDPDWSESKSLVFEVTADGEFHDYTLDLSAVSAWHGVITQLRIDPVAVPGVTVSIDRIDLAG